MTRLVLGLALVVASAFALSQPVAAGTRTPTYVLDSGHITTVFTLDSPADLR